MSQVGVVSKSGTHDKVMTSGEHEDSPYPAAQLKTDHELESSHLSASFLESVNRIIMVLRDGNATLIDKRVAVLLEGIPWLSQWITGGKVNLSGHDIYAELGHIRMIGGKQRYEELAELLGHVILEHSKVPKPLEAVVTYMPPVSFVKALIKGDFEAVNFEAVLDDFMFKM